MKIIQGTHILFAPYSDASKKTLTVHVRARKGADLLGFIKWFGRWRAYAFYPHHNTVFEKTCMRELAQLCEDMTAAHRKGESITL